MPNFSNIEEVKRLLDDAQSGEYDMREYAREAHHFVDVRNGQWEPEYFRSNDGKPRYTFDIVGPIIDQVAGDIEQAEFDIQVKPAGGEATVASARLLDGLIRNIENISNATHIFNSSGRNMVTAGIGGWRVAQKFVDDDSFDQDLVIEPIHNFNDRVWFDPNSKLQTREDANYAFVLTPLTPQDYKERFPKGSGTGISQDRISNVYWHKTDLIVIGQIYYRKEVERTLVLMSDGRVYEDNEELAAVKDELSANGITEVRKRKRKETIFVSRLFDGSDWLNQPQDTVFSYLPVIPEYGNFKVVEDKPVYRGVVEKLIDPQRVLNYSLSRQVEEGALAPRAKYWMTKKQAKGHEETLQTLNTNADPVQFYNPDETNFGPPQQNGGAQINPGLQLITQTMREITAQTSGHFAASMGDNPGLQSGVAIEKLQKRSANGVNKYMQAHEIAICQTAKVLIEAIPKVYDTRRQLRIIGEDGTQEIIQANTPVFDQQTGGVVVLNDLTKGKYDVTCQAGPSFKNKQQETVAALIEVSRFRPEVLDMATDILFNNLTSPGMSLVGERFRNQLFNAGSIPLSQQTQEEQQRTLEALQAQAAQANRPNPADLLAQAEVVKARNEQLQTQVNAQKDAAAFALKQRDADRKDAALQLQVDQAMTEARQKQEKMTFDQLVKSQEVLMDFVKSQAETLSVITNALGVEGVISQDSVDIIRKQIQGVNNAQNSVEQNT